MKTNRQQFKTFAGGGLLLLSTIILSIVSCSKHDRLNVNHQISQNLQEKFYDTAALPTEIKHLAHYLSNNKKFNNSLPTFINKNGLPRWDKAFYKSTEGKNVKGLYFIPFQNTTDKSINAYLVARRHNDTAYTIQFYNKKAMEALPKQTDSLKKHFYNTMSVFAHFEKAVNNIDSVVIKGANKAVIKNTDFKLQEVFPINRVRPLSTSGYICEAYIEIEIDYELYIYYDGSYIYINEFYVEEVTFAITCWTYEVGGNNYGSELEAVTMINPMMIMRIRIIGSHGIQIMSMEVEILMEGVTVILAAKIQTMMTIKY